MAEMITRLGYGNLAAKLPALSSPTQWGSRPSPSRGEELDLTRSRRCRRTHYEVVGQQPFRHPAETGHEVDELLSLFSEAGTATGRSPGR